MTQIIHEPNRDTLPAAMVEGTTEYDWAELPDQLQDGLREWCHAFRDWIDSP